MFFKFVCKFFLGYYDLNFSVFWFFLFLFFFDINNVNVLLVVVIDGIFYYIWFLGVVGF